MDEVVGLLREMVAIPSVSPGWRERFEKPYGEGQMAEFVVTWLRKNRVDAQKHEVLPGRENVVARLEGTRSDATVVFCSHLDTVDVQDMTIAPFGADLRDGRIWGRGACDDKGPLAAMMIAFKQMASTGRPPLTLILGATCGEELGTVGSRALAEQLSGVRAAVVGEPTDLNVVYAHKGTVRWRISTAGRSAHSSTPHLGANAIYRMGRVVAAIEAYQQVLCQRHSHPALGSATISVGTINGGDQVNSVPDSCAIQVDRRCLPGELPGEVTAALKDYLRIDQGIDFEVTVDTLSEHVAMECDEDDPAVQLALSCARSQRPDARLVTAAHATDACNLCRWGCPTPVIGPGNIADAHTATESIDVQQLQGAVEVYRQIAARVGDMGA